MSNNSQQQPSSWYPPASQPPVWGTVVPEDGSHPGYEASMKIGNTDSPRDGQVLLSDQDYTSNNDAFNHQQNHDHYGYGPSNGTKRGAYNGPGS